MAEQRRDAQATVQALSNSAALRDMNEKLLDEVRQARQRNQELESSLDPVMTELRIVREQLTALLGAPSLSGEDLEQALADAAERSAGVHQARVAELEAQLNKAQADAMKVKDELARTLREKSFIEDQYLSLEQPDSEAAALA
jgi:predicted  nucleic acid-binding Zn-ribbon protein